MTISGIDLSHFQANVPDLNGLAFVIHKCTQGVNYVDPYYAGRQSSIRSQGLVWGAYHFMSSTDDPNTQAAWFASNSSLQVGDFAALDLEDDGNWYQFGQDQIAAKATALIQAITKLIAPKRLVVYCNRDTYNNIVIPFGVPLQDGLWIASPSFTPQMTWLFWQYTSNPYDEDYANFGSIADMRNWAQNGQSSAPPPPPPRRTAFVMEDGMPMGAWPAATSEDFHHLTWPCGPDNSLITQAAWFSLSVGGSNSSANGHVWFMSSNNGQTAYLHDEDWQIGADQRKYWGCPAGTDMISVSIAKATNEVAWSLELQAK